MRDGPIEEAKEDDGTYSMLPEGMDTEALFAAKLCERPASSPRAFEGAAEEAIDESDECEDCGEGPRPKFYHVSVF